METLNEDKLRLLVEDNLPRDMLVICEDYKEARKAFHSFAEYACTLSPHIETKHQTMQVCFKDSTMRWLGFQQERTIDQIRGCNYQRIFVETENISPYEKEQVGRRLRPHRLWGSEKAQDLIGYIKEHWSE